MPQCQEPAIATDVLALPAPNSAPAIGLVALVIRSATTKSHF
jgi:hypothetical protein